MNIREYRIEHHICTRCGLNPSLAGRRLCKECTDRLNAGISNTRSTKNDIVYCRDCDISYLCKSPTKKLEMCARWQYDMRKEAYSSTDIRY